MRPLIFARRAWSTDVCFVPARLRLARLGREEAVSRIKTERLRQRPPTETSHRDARESLYQVIGLIPLPDPIVLEAART